ncbi:MAG: type III-A CRISPR-associated RAMP protein Csm5 [Bacteroidales bacterium]|nr:type III-A CRISPR-associated RAMP protein Csm5 [Bacteroidales bacterium]MCM1147752.1 type III-A CRISPR-associated RAMP protein Csm5 [Bacteroidales bacterium]MCM1206638.1 type III-A CRISPR-associated RAMP protein Csm5 [Bacillota bacterium]MCM1510621.1 type III-A CRISPR-associated RAMP protein Csm5 [Clostridium sp.]
MSKIKIETLTAVHIGSGEVLTEGLDFFKAKDSEGYNVLAVVDAKKLMKIIGPEHVDEWIIHIERQRPVTELVAKYAPKAVVDDYARIIDFGFKKTEKQLKTFIHDGMGWPYIPGSSIKGAIRTAVLAQLLHGEGQAQINAYLKQNPNYNKNQAAENDLFGSNPNESVFRFLHVGDARFGGLMTSARRMVNINERKFLDYYDESKPQLVEVLVPKDESAFDIKLDLEKYEHCKSYVKPLPDCLSSLPELFRTINNHTKQLLESEIKYWKKRENAEQDSSNCIEKYIDKCKDILSTVEECKDGESCVLRIGHGSGWRFITGAWTENSDYFENVIKQARPHNERYTEYDFPKSRRVTSGPCSLLGFVRLTITDSKQ